jgi:hypothetical protein
MKKLSKTRARVPLSFQDKSFHGALGAVLLAAFIPVHIQLWAKFPVWYHLVFLGTLVPLVALGGTFTRNRSRI